MHGWPHAGSRRPPALAIHKDPPGVRAQLTTGEVDKPTTVRFLESRVMESNIAENGTKGSGEFRLGSSRLTFCASQQKLLGSNGPNHPETSTAC